MSEKPKDEPQRSVAGKRVAEAREARLAAALRANLQRRKTQARERDEATPEAKKP
jgi:hypothetical protein